jgi:hypothetical protein
MANGELVNGELVNGELVNGELVNGELVNGELVNGELVNGELVNGELVNCQCGFRDHSLYFIRCGIPAVRPHSSAVPDPLWYSGLTIRRTAHPDPAPA